MLTSRHALTDTRLAGGREQALGTATARPAGDRAPRGGGRRLSGTARPLRQGSRRGPDRRRGSGVGHGWFSGSWASSTRCNRLQFRDVRDGAGWAEREGCQRRRRVRVGVRGRAGCRGRRGRWCGTGADSPRCPSWHSANAPMDGVTGCSRTCSHAFGCLWPAGSPELRSVLGIGLPPGCTAPDRRRLPTPPVRLRHHLAGTFRGQHDDLAPAVVPLPKGVLPIVRHDRPGAPATDNR